MKKKGYWVLLGVMVFVGALLISNYCFQRQPLIPDVNAQMSQFDMGSYVSTSSYGMDNIGSYIVSYPGSQMPTYGDFSKVPTYQACPTALTCGSQAYGSC